MFSGCSLAWHVPWALRDAPQRTISAMQPPSKTPQAPRQQPLARRCGSSEESAVASRRRPSEVRCGPRRICKMHYELPGGSARCKISPAATAIPRLVNSRSRPMGLPPALLTCQELNRAHHQPIRSLALPHPFRLVCSCPENEVVLGWMASRTSPSAHRQIVLEIARIHGARHPPLVEIAHIHRAPRSLLGAGECGQQQKINVPGRTTRPLPQSQQR